MICESCGCEMRIVGSAIRVEGDTSPEEQTRVFRVQTLKCQNKNCPKPDEKIIEHEMNTGK